MSLLRSMVSDAMVNTRRKLVLVLWENGILLQEKLMHLISDATTSFLEHSKEIFVILFVINMGPRLKGSCVIVVIYFAEYRCFISTGS